MSWKKIAWSSLFKLVQIKTDIFNRVWLIVLFLMPYCEKINQFQLTNLLRVQAFKATDPHYF